MELLLKMKGNKDWCNAESILSVIIRHCAEYDALISSVFEQAIRFVATNGCSILRDLNRWDVGRFDIFINLF